MFMDIFRLRGLKKQDSIYVNEITDDLTESGNLKLREHFQKEILAKNPQEYKIVEYLFCNVNNPDTRFRNLRVALENGLAYEDLRFLSIGINDGTEQLITILPVEFDDLIEIAISGNINDID